MHSVPKIRTLLNKKWYERICIFSNFILILKGASLSLLHCIPILLTWIITFSVCNVIMSRYVRDVIVLNSIISYVGLSQSKAAILWGLQGNGWPELCKHTIVIRWGWGNLNRKEWGTYQAGFTYIQNLLKLGYLCGKHWCHSEEMIMLGKCCTA